MEGKKRNGKNMIQNIAILLLSVSAVVLIAQTQLQNLGKNAGSYLSGLLSSSAPSSAVTATSLTDIPASVRIAVTGTYGRYGEICLNTAAEDFAGLGTLLAEALGSAGASSSCGEAEFRAALKTTSVYYDFDTDLPLSVLAGLVGTSVSDGSLFARRLLLAADGTSGVKLYLLNEDGDYSCCGTAVTRAQLMDLVSDYQLGNASFMFELGESYGKLEPYSLLPSDLPETKVLSAANPLSDTDALLTRLHFNPNTNSRYTESSGTEVIVEGERTLRIRTDGAVICENGGDTSLTVSSSPEPAEEEAVVGAYQLVSSLLGGQTGDAVLSLQDVQKTGASLTLRFGYLINGVPVRFSDGSAAAEVVLSGAQVTSLTLRFRQYTATGEDALLLPLPQALAIARDGAGGELTESYVDGGTDTVTAAWLTD